MVRIISIKFGEFLRFKETTQLQGPYLRSFDILEKDKITNNCIKTLWKFLCIRKKNKKKQTPQIRPLKPDPPKTRPPQKKQRKKTKPPPKKQNKKNRPPPQKNTENCN